MTPAHACPPRGSVGTDFTAIFGTEGVSLGENFEQVMAPEALCQKAAGSLNCPSVRANSSAAKRPQREQRLDLFPFL